MNRWKEWARLGATLALVAMLAACGSDQEDPASREDGGDPHETRVLSSTVSDGVSQAFEMDEPIDVPTHADQRQPAMAFDGTNYLVVWEDAREERLYAARVTPAGDVLDPGGILLSTSATEGREPAVAFDGTNYLVVWQDARNATSQSELDIYGARLDTAGTVLGATDFAITTSPGNDSQPAVAFDGTNFWVVWANDATEDIHARRVDSSGVVVDSSDIEVSSNTDSSAQVEPEIACGADNCLIVWEDGRNGVNTQFGNDDIYGTRVDSSGAVLDSDGIELATNPEHERRPAVASDGTHFLVVWEEGLSHNRDIRSTRVYSSGTVSITYGVDVSNASGVQEAPSVGFDGTQYLVAWRDERDNTDGEIYAARVGTSGNVVDRSGFMVSTSPDGLSAPAMASDGTNSLLAWVDGESGALDLYGARVDAAGTVLDTSGLLLTINGNAQSFPAVATDGTNYLIVWEDRRGEDVDLYGVRVDAQGVVLDSEAIAISTADGHQARPAIAFDGTHYLVVWMDERDGSFDIYGTRVDPSGEVVDTDGFVIEAAPERQSDPDIVFGDSQYLVVWTDRRRGDGGDIYGKRVDTDATVIDDDVIVVSEAEYPQIAPAASFDGTNFGVAWGDQRFGHLDIRWARLDDSGAVLDPEGVLVATGPDHQTVPAVGFDGTRTMVVWQDDRDGSFDIYGARLDEDGAAVDGVEFPISTGSEDRAGVSIGFDGLNFVVSWHENHDGDWNLRGVEVETSGDVADQELVLSEGEGSETQPAIASGAPGQFLVAYHHYQEAEGVNRVFGRLAAFNVPPTAEDQSVSTDEDTAVAITLAASDSDGDTLTYTVTGDPSSGTLSGDAPDLEYTPNADFHGEDSFTFQVDDGSDDSPEATVTIEVVSVNDAPWLIEPTPADGSTHTITVGEEFVITIAGEDIDHAADSLTYGFDPLPEGARYDEETGVFAWEPDESAVGDHQLRLSVTDGDLSDERQITLQVVSAEGDAGSGSPDAGTDDGKGSASRKSEGGCTSTGGSPLSPALVWVVLGVAVLRLRRRRG